MLTTIISGVVIGIVVAIVSSVVTVRLSMRRFYSEKWWERKAEAYTTIVEALFHIHLHIDESIDEGVRGQAISPDRDRTLAMKASEARDHLRRAAALGTFIISPAATDAVSKCLKNLVQADSANNYGEYLDAQGDAVSACLSEIRRLAKEDLNIS